MDEFSAMPIYFGEFKYCILIILLALADKGFSSLHILYFGIAATPISSATNQPVTLIGNSKKHLREAKCGEQMLELGVGSHFARFSRTKSTHCLRLFLASDPSSPANGMKCKEIPRFVLETLEQPPTTHIPIWHFRNSRFAISLRLRVILRSPN